MIDRRAVLLANAADYARTAMDCIQREFPHLPMIFAAEPGPYPRHREQHPSFYGALDWHSAVEMHWVLVRLLRRCDGALPAERVRAVLSEQLSAGNLQAEAEFFADGYGRSRERPYGWGWLLTLAHELRSWDDPDGRDWAHAVEPLAEVLTSNLLDWLPKQTYPVRSGVHPNSAFGLLRSYDYAAWSADHGDARLAEAIEDAVRRWFLDDADYPAHYEPSGSDFLSPALAEAELVSRVLPAAEFAGWFDRFLPEAVRGKPARLFDPVVISDTSDGQLAHLAGLNLSRAWSLVVLAARLPAGDECVPTLLSSAERHAEASLRHVVGGDYMVEHWLAAYALGCLTA